MPKPKILKSFEDLCDAQNSLTVDQARKIVLSVTEGLCPATFLVNSAGRPLDMLSICAKTHALVAQNSPTSTTYDLETNARNLTASETKAMDEVCRKETTKEGLMLQRMMETHRTLPRYRKEIVKTLKDEVKAIHFFRWDGSCRSSVDEIRWALCYYPSTKKRMDTTKKVLLSLIKGVAAVGLDFLIGANRHPMVRQTLAESLQHTQHLHESEIFAKSAQHVNRKKHILLLVAGLGCGLSTHSQATARHLERKYGIQAKVYCNEHIGDTLKHIAKHYLEYVPKINDPFTQYVYAEIKKYLSLNYTVTVWGHSYGGAVTSRIAQYLNNNHLLTPALQLVTFGSIYVPQPRKTGDVNIMHYMFYNDVALKVNRLDPQRDRFVKWEECPIDVGQEIPPSLLGNVLEWQIHTNYVPLFMKLAKKMKKFHV